METRIIKFRAYQEFPKYEIGDDGSVYSLDFNHSKTRKALKQYSNEDGYKYVFLVVDGKRYKRLCHRLVAISFIPNPENKPQVNHKNGIRFDNDVTNLEWVTSKENTIHGYRSNGRKVSEKQKQIMSERARGAGNPKAKLNESIVLSIRRLRAKGISVKEVSERHGISRAQVSSIATGRTWKHI